MKKNVVVIPPSSKSKVQLKKTAQVLPSDCEDEMQDMVINYSDFCKESSLQFPAHKETGPVKASKDILADDFDPS